MNKDEGDPRNHQPWSKKLNVSLGEDGILKRSNHHLV